jgi:SsrA-binding protein
MAQKQQDASQHRRIAENRKARFKFEVLETWEAGLVLRGTEVKTLRGGKVSLDEAYGRIDGDEVFLIGAHIAEYTHGNRQNHEPTRRRKLLLHKREINKLKAKVTQRGLTLVPLALYFNERGIAKLTLALCRGKNIGDKRDVQRKREAVREIESHR